MKILTIIGARPQFIKAAVLSREIKLFDKINGQEIKETIIHTGQHFNKNMSDVFFEQMQIPRPNYNLGIHSLGHGAMTGQMLEKIESVIIAEKPDIVLVYGDTNSTIAGALAAKKLHIKVAHVEAGLRSFNIKMPEEINRILTDRISDFLFCPTQTAVENLKSEGISNSDSKIINCGDIMYEAALYYSSKSKAPSFNIPEKFVLATIHRAENTNDPERLSGIIEALKQISNQIPIILPLHPRTRKIFEIYRTNINKTKNILIVEPVGYLEMIYLLQNCSLVMTDSGGLQKEAFFFKKYCITLRDETEWVELVENKYNMLVGSEMDKIIDGFESMKNQSLEFNINLFGNGTTSHTIIESFLI